MNRRLLAVVATIATLGIGYYMLSGSILRRSTPPRLGVPGAPRLETSFDGKMPVLPTARVLGSEDTFGWLYEMRVASDDALVVIDRQPLVGEETLLVVDRETGAIKQRAARPGQGPGEVRNVASIDFLPSNQEQFSLYDTITQRLTIFDLSAWTGAPIGYRVHDDSVSTFSAEWLSDTKVVMNGFFDDHLLRFYEADEDEIAGDYDIDVDKVEQYLQENTLLVGTTDDGRNFVYQAF